MVGAVDSPGVAGGGLNMDSVERAGIPEGEPIDGPATSQVCRQWPSLFLPVRTVSRATPSLADSPVFWCRGLTGFPLNDRPPQCAADQGKKSVGLVVPGLQDDVRHGEHHVVFPGGGELESAATTSTAVAGGGSSNNEGGSGGGRFNHPWSQADYTRIIIQVFAVLAPLYLSRRFTQPASPQPLAFPQHVTDSPCCSQHKRPRHH